MAKPKRPSEREDGSSATLKANMPAAESQEIVHAIRHGKIDALIVQGEKGDQVMVLEGAEHPYRVLIETINDGAATLDSNGTVLYANNRFMEIVNVPAEKLIGTSLQGHFLPSAREQIERLIQNAAGKSSDGEISLNTAAGCQRLIRFSLNPVRNSRQQNICVVATDLTELLQANEALRASEDSLRLLSARLLQLQDEERRRIARDLHDVTGQKLAIQSMYLSRLVNESSGLDAETRSVLTECKELTGQLIDEIRTVSYLLHPPLLDELGLASALDWYAQGFSQRTGIAIDVDVPVKLLRLPPEVEVTFYRIVQESLTNVHRYSGSLKAYVRVKATDDMIVVEIGDYGRGIAPETLKRKQGSVVALGVGIQGMTERMRQLSGTLAIASEINKGTVVKATLPFAHLRIPNRSESAVHAGGKPGDKARDPSVAAEHRRILIADDHELLRRGVSTLLQTEEGWEICGEATNGQEAVEKAAALHPDLVIIDIDMPVLNGLAAARQILRARPQTKVLIFTVHQSDQILRDIHATGAHGCVSKARGSQDLLRVAKQILGNDTSLPSAGLHTGT